VAVDTGLTWRQRLDQWRIQWQRRKLERLDHADQRAEARREQRIEREQRRMENRLKSELRRDIRKKARAIRDTATQLGLCYVRRTGRKKGTIAEIKFRELVATPAAYFLRVRRMPYQTNTTMLEEEYVLQDLGLAVGAPVSVYHNPAHGFWLQIERTGIGSIPRFIEYAEVLPELPKSAGPLAFPLGFAANRKFKYGDLEELPHLLIAGTTGGGKSVMLHNIICTILQRSTPKKVRMVLIDLKGGVELSVYRDVPHLLELGEDVPQKVFKKEDIETVLQAVHTEANRRLQMFERHRVRNLARWNQTHRGDDYLPRIVVVVDEIANAMLVRSIKRRIEPVIADIGAQGRAPGIHLIISTQHPKSEVVTSLLKANLPAQIAFSTVSISASVVILGHKGAHNLGPPGRHVFQAERDKFVCQAPYLSEGLVDDIIDSVVSGEATDALLPKSVSLQEIAEWCIREQGGAFVIDDVYTRFRPQQVTHREIRRLQAELMESQKDVWVDDVCYRLERGRRNSRVFVEVEPEVKSGEVVTDD